MNRHPTWLYRSVRALPLARVALLLLATLTPLLWAAPALADTCYVSAIAQTNGSGQSWNDAFDDLQSALRAANCTVIRVTAGEYTPTFAVAPTDYQRGGAFVIRPGVQIYGSYSLVLPATDPREPGAHPTILSGDIDYNDVNTDGNSIDETRSDIKGGNSYNVVGLLPEPASAATRVIDGVTITGGMAIGTNQTTGGGIFCISNVPNHRCSPSINNVTISGNVAAFGAGMGIEANGTGASSEPTLTKVTFSGNAADDSGGGLYSSAPGNAVGEPELTNVTFSANSAQGFGGAMYLTRSIAILTNVTFHGNHAGGDGGAIWAAGFAEHKLTNVILWGDTGGAANTVNEVHDPSSVRIISYSIVQGGCPAGSPNATCNQVINGDPKLGPLQYNGAATPTMRLAAGSAAIDAGACHDPNAAPADGIPITDQRGLPRPGGSGCDIGAVEYGPYYHLAMAVTEGGQVAATPAGLLQNGISACRVMGGSCSAYYNAQTAVALSAVADSGLGAAPDYQFDHWSHTLGSACNTVSPAAATTVIMTGDMSCVAVFIYKKYKISGVVHGLAPGNSVELRLNGDESLSVADNGDPDAGVDFSFLSQLDLGSSYAVVVQTQPSTPTQTCTVANASGNVPKHDVANVDVTCITPAYTVTVTGAVAGGHGTLGPTNQTIAGGSSATLTVAADTGYHLASISGCGGTLSGFTYTTGVVTANCTVTASFTSAPSTVLTATLIEDDEYVGYGETRAYKFVVTNDGATALHGVSVHGIVSSQIDTASPAFSWACIGGTMDDPSPGLVPCLYNSDTGALDQTIDLPSLGFATWTITVPVKTDAAGGALAVSVTTSGADGPAFTVTDSDTLVIFRNGFD